MVACHPAGDTDEADLTEEADCFRRIRVGSRTSPLGFFSPVRSWNSTHVRDPRAIRIPWPQQGGKLS
jgi:hypothetical protein